MVEQSDRVEEISEYQEGKLGDSKTLLSLASTSTADTAADSDSPDPDATRKKKIAKRGLRRIEHIDDSVEWDRQLLKDRFLALH